MKRIFIISLVLLLLSSLFFGIYFLVFREKPVVEEIVTDEVDIPADVPLKNVFGTLSKVTHLKAFAPTLTPGGNRLRYVDAATGNIIETDLEGSNAQVLFANNFTDIGHADWSSERDLLLLQSKTDRSYFVYDINTGTKAPFKNSVDHAVWLKSGDRILYKYFDVATGKRSLNIAQDDGSSWKALADLPWHKASFAQIPQSSFAAFWNTPNAYEELSLQRVSTTSGGSATSLFGTVFGGDVSFSPKGNRMLISSSDQKGGHGLALGVANKNGGEYQVLGIPTLADKTTWSQDEKTIYYAQPNEIPNGSILPNDWHDRKFLSSDSFWKVDVITGKKERILPLEDLTQKVDAQDLLLTPSENFLFFHNRVDGNIYRIAL